MENRMKVLMVDDRPENLFVLETILKDEDVTFDKATSGNEALSMLLEKDYALVLMDVQMPDIDGFETAKLMKGMNKTKYIPIIFVTAISKEEYYAFKGYDIGAIDYIYKPIEPIVLKSKVRVFAELHRQKMMYKDQSDLLNLKVKELEEVKQQLIALNSELVQISNMDSLTQIANRRAFDETIKVEINRANRDKTELAVLMLDIDFFKQYNDHYGHVKGDEVLQKVAEEVKKSVCRPADLVARYGGEEFTVILPDTCAKGAIHVADTIRKNVEALEIPNVGSDVSDWLTVSIGIVLKNTETNTQDILLRRADKALYEAKKRGRNQVVDYNVHM